MLPTIRIDIVSDLMCPWCIIGYKKLEQAMLHLGPSVNFEIYWQPFELNPDMPAKGRLLSSYLLEKYRNDQTKLDADYQRIMDIGISLGFHFGFNENSRIENSFLAHQLLYWAKSYHKQTELELALFAHHFTFQQNINDIELLTNIAQQIGLDKSLAKTILTSNRYASEVRAEQQFWLQNDVQAVPAFVFNQQYLLSGAQEVETLQNVIETILNESNDQINY